MGQRLHLLRQLFGRVWSILEAVCTGSLLISDAVLNQYYVKLCLLIENELGLPDMSELLKEYRRPFESLYNLQDADIDWEYDVGPFVSGFFGKIEELWIENGQEPYEDTEIADFIEAVDGYIERYRKKKEKTEANWRAQMKEKAKEWAAEMGEFQPIEFTTEASASVKRILPDNEFDFIEQEGLRNKLKRDYDELRIVLKHAASKSIMVLCGGILEALLIDALSIEKEDAKFAYYQKYLEAKDKNQKPPDLEKWQFYQLIEIAAQRKIISADVRKISHIIKDYRNLIHLKAEIRDKLSVDKNVATSVVHLLLKAIDDISRWFKERNT